MRSAGTSLIGIRVHREKNTPSVVLVGGRGWRNMGNEVVGVFCITYILLCQV